jgi:Spy/CpxP family protein refolding chaperone
VKIWKVILATVVIFAAGLLTGAFITRSELPAQPQKPQVEAPIEPPNPIIVQERFLNRMKDELKLTSEQTNRLEKIFAESRARMKILTDLIEPEWRGELKDVRDKIRAELQPEQQKKFEEMLKHPHRPDPNEMRRRNERRGTNQPPRSNAPPA